MDRDDLPEGWRATPLGDVCAPKVPQSGPDASSESFVYVDIGCVDSQTKSISKRQVLATGSAPSRARQPLRVGDVIVSMTRPTLNAVAQVPAEYDDALASTGFHVLRPTLADSGFIFAAVRSRRFVETMTQAVQGALYPAIRPADVKAFPIWLPPLPEQKRIVAKIEELTARSRRAKEALDAVPPLLDQLRQSILAAAFRGDLTADWRAKNRDAGPAASFLEQIRAERRTRFERGEGMRVASMPAAETARRRVYQPPRSPDFRGEELLLPPSWTVTSLETLVECLDALRAPIKRDDRSEGSFPYYGANGQVGTIGEYLFDEDLVLVTEDETFYGRTKPLAYRVSGKCWVNNHAHVLRPVPPIDVDFVCYLLMHYPVWPWLSGTTGRAKLTQGALLSFPVPLPPLLEMTEIVRRVANALAHAQTVATLLESHSTWLQSLDSSIFDRAFGGVL